MRVDNDKIQSAIDEFHDRFEKARTKGMQSSKQDDNFNWGWQSGFLAALEALQDGAYK